MTPGEIGETLIAGKAVPATRKQFKDLRAPALGLPAGLPLWPFLKNHA
jgi:hypothetical protein